MESLNVKGMFRVQIDDEGKIVGDSGWVPNQITNLGFNKYLCFALASSNGSLYPSHVGLGTGTVPGATATSLDGEITDSVRTTVTAATSSTSKVVQYTATFASSWFTASHDIANIGLFNSNASGTLFAGNTYSSSNVATNQAVNITYTISFS